MNQIITYMKVFAPLIVCLILGVVLIGGCMSNQTNTAPTPSTPSPQSSAPTQSSTITLSDHYLQKKYSFQSEKDVYTEQFRVDSPSWGIEFQVNPMNEDPQYTWFEINVTNMDTGQTDNFGYGRTYNLDKHQLHPMYNTGPYKIEMRGNRVSVDVNIAKRTS